MPKTNSYLQSALATEQFIASNRIDTQQGLTWSRTPGGKPTHSLYHGSAGIVLFYLELYRAFNDADYLRTAQAAGDELLAYVNEKREQFITVGFYSGWPGYCFVLQELYKQTGDARYREGALLAFNAMTRQSSALGAGIGWIEPIPFSDITGIKGEREVIDLSVGAAGAGVLYLYAHRESLSDEALELAIKTADRLLEVAEQTPDGLRWLMTVDMPFQFTAPNFAHGGAGVGYFLADLYRETGDQRYLDAAISAAAYVQSRTTPAGEGVLVCHIEEQQPPTTFYLGVCHGPAGTGRLMYLLNQITGDPAWLKWMKTNFAGLTSTGVPEQRSKGLWQNYGQCCGDAGIGDYALFLFHATQDPEYLDFAERIGRHMIEYAETSDGQSWQQAEHRSRPDFMETQTGYMQGAAGIGSFLTHLGTVLDNRPIKVILPETPFSYR